MSGAQPRPHAAAGKAPRAKECCWPKPHKPALHPLALRPVLQHRCRQPLAQKLRACLPAESPTPPHAQPHCASQILRGCHGARQLCACLAPRPAAQTRTRQKSAACVLCFASHKAAHAPSHRHRIHTPASGRQVKTQAGTRRCRQCPQAFALQPTAAVPLH